MTETRPAGVTTYTYNNADQLLSRTGPSGSMSYAYDADGNQTQAGARTFAYDLANRMTSTTSGSTTIAYTYDGVGKRLLASSGSQASKKTKYLWDPNWPLYQLALERDGNNALRRRYVHGQDLISMFAGGATYYYHHDLLGSVANLTSASGAAQWTYTYEPFGTLRTETKHTPQAPTNLMRFTGELLDLDTGLYHLRARQYDPSLGRFLSTDLVPPPNTQSKVSAYVYRNHRPTLLVDPSGLRGRPFGWEDCPWLKDLPLVGEAYCEGYLTLGPMAQAILGAIVEGPRKYGAGCLEFGVVGGALAKSTGPGAALACAIGAFSQFTVEEKLSEL